MHSKWQQPKVILFSRYMYSYFISADVAQTVRSVPILKVSLWLRKVNIVCALS